MTSIKEHVQGKVIFVYYRDGSLWYLTETGLKFPVPLVSGSSEIFMSVEKGISMTKYISNYIKQIEKNDQ